MHAIGIPAGDVSTRMVIFESVVEGGFGRKLKLEEGAMLDLDKLEAGTHPEAGPMEEPSHDEPQAAAHASTEKADPSASQPHHRRKRLTLFKSRGHAHSRPAAGPALAIVDAEASPSAPATKEERDKMHDEGVKVSIRLAALDENGDEFTSPNAQTTYLHVVRVGLPTTAAEGESHVEDNRPWLVKVVKREATVKPCLFWTLFEFDIIYSVLDWPSHLPFTRNIWPVLSLACPFSTYRTHSPDPDGPRIPSDDAARNHDTRRRPYIRVSSMFILTS